MSINVKFSICCIFLFVSIVYSQPKPGDIFKEFTHRPTYDEVISDYRNDFSELDPGSKGRKEEGSWMSTKLLREVQSLDIDLENAIKAEMSVEYWGGHIGTSEQKFRVNGNDWIYIPQPHNTPGRPECYHRTILGNESVPIPLNQLRNGYNEFQFTAGPQICHSFDFGFYWIYAFTVRIYYEASTSHPEGKVISPSPGTQISDNAEIKAIVTNSSIPIKQVDFIGYFEDFDWDGNGIYRQWHYQTRYGRMTHIIGTSTSSPYSVTWHNAWVPDQEKPVKIMARIMDKSGICFMTSVVDDLTLVRKGYSVKMYKPYDVPENFSVRIGRRKSCKIKITDELSKTKAARLVVSTWSGKTDDGALHEIGINGKRISDNFGIFHDYSFDVLHVPLDYLKKGVNEVYIHSEFEHHMMEVNWPGPVLLIKYDQ